jgi:rod shape-determining protein MreD
MARPLFGLLLTIVAFLQAAVLPVVLPIEVAPNPVLILIFLWSLRRSVGEAVAWAFGVGILLDLLALDPLGLNGLALLPAVLLGPLARRRFFQSGLIVPIVLVGVATVVGGLLLVGLRGLAVGPALPVAAALRVVVPQALLNALLVPPLYLIVGWLDRRLLEAQP